MRQRREDPQVQVINRAAGILKVVGESPHGVSLSELGEKLKLPRSTVNRIVVSLEYNDLVIWDRNKGTVRLAFTIAFWVKNMQRDVRNEFTSFMQKLRKEVEETVDLGILHKGQGLLLARLEGPHLLQIGPTVGSEFPVHCTAGGKVMLGLLTNTEIKRLLPKNLPLTTAGKIKTWDELLFEIEEGRKTGIGYDIEERGAGICAAAIACRDPFGAIVSLTVPMPQPRFEAKRELVVAKLMEIQREISEAFAVPSVP